MGPEKEAPSLTPSALPATPPALPAKVVTVPPGETVRSTLLPVSATYSTPPAPSATPRGVFSSAVVPSPSEKPATPLPATVTVSPFGSTARMRLLSASATNTRPSAPQQARPSGPLKLAAMPSPSA